MAIQTGNDLPLAGPKPEDPYLSPPGSVPPATGPGRARPTQTHMHDVPACVAQTSRDCAVRHMQVHYEEKATMKSLVNGHSQTRK